ncbi:MAG: SDR family oxidoreductase [Spirochaetales bacterium]|nr:SDR family oxidoreductase [Spirochaetales bacterium]
MKIFVTGASGHVGSALIPELLGSGHSVVGLARSETAEKTLKAAGADVHRGDLDDLEGLAKAASAADGVIHLAYRHDLAFGGQPNGFAQAAQLDLAAVKALGTALAGTHKPLVVTSGTALFALHGKNRLVTEADFLPEGLRVDCENWAVSLASQGVRSAVVRLAPSVHSTLDHHGFLAMLVALARKNGFAAYVGTGENVWNAVHTRDAARLYRLVLEKAPAGTRWHAAAEEAVTFRSIAEAIGKNLGLTVRSLSPEEAPGYFGGFLSFGQMHCPASSTSTRTTLGWIPTHNTLLEDLALPHYFSRA